MPPGIAMIDRDLEPERIRQPLLQRDGVGILRRLDARLGFLRRAGHSLNAVSASTSRTDIEPSTACLASAAASDWPIKGTRMAGGEFAV